MSNELTITSIYTEVAITEDGLLDSISKHGAYSKAHLLRQCYDVYRYHQLIKSTTAHGSVERKAKINEAVKRLGPDATMSTFRQRLKVGTKIQAAYDNGETPEIALNRTMRDYLYPQLGNALPKSNDQISNALPKSSENAMQKFQAKYDALQAKLDDTLEELDAYKTWKKKMLSAIRQQDLEYIRQLMKE